MIYAYECPDCGAVKDEIRRVEDRNNCPECDLCKVTMKKLIGGHNVVGDMEPYYDENLETGIKSRKHRERVMKEKGVYEKIGRGWI